MIGELITPETVAGGALSLAAVVFWLVKKHLSLAQRVSRLEAKLGTKPPFELD